MASTSAGSASIESIELQNGDDDVLFGNEGRDLIIAGAGHDMADGDQEDDEPRRQIVAEVRADACLERVAVGAHRLLSAGGWEDNVVR